MIKRFEVIPYTSILIFFALQVGAGILFKTGALFRSFWLYGFVLGNILGISSTYFLMNVYRVLNPNIGEAICRGGYFILIQMTFMIFFGSRLSLVQWGGVTMIAIGIVLVSAFGNPALQ